jgi:predicted XRE-type DNA-binding protein
MLFQATITCLFFSSNTFKQKLNDMDASTNLQEYPEVKTYIEELYEKGMEKVVAAFIRHNTQMRDAQIAEMLEVTESFVARVCKKEA